MPCETMNFGGTTAIICSRGTRRKPCVYCGRPSSKLCDFKLTGAKEGKTCDRPMCLGCAVHVEPDTDYCHPHAEMVNHPAQETLFKEGGQ